MTKPTKLVEKLIEKNCQSTANAEIEQHYDSGFLAEKLDCSKSSIQRYARDGLIPKPKRIGGRWLWSHSQLTALLG